MPLTKVTHMKLLSRLITAAILETTTLVIMAAILETIKLVIMTVIKRIPVMEEIPVMEVVSNAGIVMP